MLKIEKFVFSIFQVNTYLVYDSETSESIVIDPGCSNKKEEDLISERINNLGINIKYVVNTHLHIDHIFGNYFFVNKYKAKTIYSHSDEFLIPIMQNESMKYNISINSIPTADIYFEDIDFIEVGNLKLKPLFTPGHSPGEYSLFSEKELICFSGDVLFHESIGRTDLWQSDYDTLIASVYEKLFVLPDETIVYPGHGPYTTIAHEKNFNPFL